MRACASMQRLRTLWRSGPPCRASGPYQSSRLLREQRLTWTERDGTDLTASNALDPSSICGGPWKFARQLQRLRLSGVIAVDFVSIRVLARRKKLAEAMAAKRAYSRHSRALSWGL